jgi:hypothetical protein
MPVAMVNLAMKLTPVHGALVDPVTMLLTYPYTMPMN